MIAYSLQNRLSELPAVFHNPATTSDSFQGIKKADRLKTSELVSNVSGTNSTNNSSFSRGQETTPSFTARKNTDCNLSASIRYLAASDCKTDLTSEILDQRSDSWTKGRTSMQKLKALKSVTKAKFRTNKSDTQNFSVTFICNETQTSQTLTSQSHPQFQTCLRYICQKSTPNPANKTEFHINTMEFLFLVLVLLRTCIQEKYPEKFDSWHSPATLTDASSAIEASLDKLTCPATVFELSFATIKKLVPHYKKRCVLAFHLQNVLFCIYLHKNVGSGALTQNPIRFQRQFTEKCFLHIGAPIPNLNKVQQLLILWRRAGAEIRFQSTSGTLSAEMKWKRDQNFFLRYLRQENEQETETANGRNLF